MQYDVIIIGGSYSGLSAGMALGRSLRNVLIIDSGSPCNRQTPHSHNFITQDGSRPAVIAAVAREQVEKYDTVRFAEDLVTEGRRSDNGFAIGTASGKEYKAKKLIFATGIRDFMPNIEGFAECWGISVIHCPYCHGYEVHHKKTGILGNGDYGFEFSRMISHWTDDLTLYTNGPSTLTVEQTAALLDHNINIVETEISGLDHSQGYVKSVAFKDGSASAIEALYARTEFEQHCPVPQDLGCEIADSGHLKVDVMQKTTVPGIYACGDNASPMRSVSNAVAAGTMAGAALNKELIEEEF